LKKNEPTESIKRNSTLENKQKFTRISRCYWK
jgi:hypothetical protein